MAVSLSMRTKRMLAEQIRKNRKQLFEWHLRHTQIAPPAFYCSVDLRDSGHKIVPVDSNLFPAGFNNICPEDQRTAPAVIRAQLDGMFARIDRPSPKSLLVIPESHTTNGYYIENLFYLTQILRDAGLEVRVGWSGETPLQDGKPFELNSITEKKVLAEPFKNQTGVIQIETASGGWTPDAVLLNNDFSSGYPKILDGVRQPIFPPHTLGWHTRKKSDHFLHYNRLAAEFGQIVGIDPWLLQIDSVKVDNVDFNEDQGIDRVAAEVDKLLERTRLAYAQHKIDRKPFAFVKNNSGTYGMGIMVVHDANELREMNRRTKNKMSVGKNKLPISSVIVQEGVPTSTLVDRLAAEPVIYLVGCELIGGFLRTNTEKGDEDNLNSQGMVFRKLCMSDLKRLLTEDDAAEAEQESEEEPVMELVYGAIARISALATGYELKENPIHDKN